MLERLSQGLRGIVGVAILLSLAACGGKQRNATIAGPSTQPAATPAPRPVDPYAWRSLLDGKTLTNWTSTEFGGEGKPRVKDGCLIIPVGAPLTGVTWAGGELPKVNYEISLEAQRIDGSDFFCGLTFPVNDNFATLVLGGWGGQLCGISCIDGYDAANNETTKFIDFKEKQWYRVRMLIVKDKLQAWLNDDQIVDAPIKDRRVGTRIEVEASQPFGIATYMTTAGIRDLRIRNLRDYEIQEASKEKE